MDQMHRKRIHCVRSQDAEVLPTPLLVLECAFQGLCVLFTEEPFLEGAGRSRSLLPDTYQA